MSATPLIFRLLNPMMKAVLKSPLHPVLSDKIMVITFTGRRTGSEYSTPVSYHLEDGTVTCFTHVRWWVNLTANPVVRPRMRGREVTGIAEPIPEDTAKKFDGLSKLLRAVPGDARFYNVDLDENGDFNPDDLKRAAENATMIVVRLEDSSPAAKLTGLD